MRYFIQVFFLSIFFISSCTRASHFSRPVVGKPHSPEKQKFIEVYGHRGGRSYSPENTIFGYNTALQVGINWADLDIVYTKDRQIIVYHDLFLNSEIVRNANGKFVHSKIPVYELTASELQKYDVGMINPKSKYASYFPNQVPVSNTHMPLLKDVIEYVDKYSKHKVNFQIEIKTDPTQPNLAPPPNQYAQDLYDVLKKYDLIERVEVHAFDWRYLYALQKLNPKIKTGYLVSSIEIKDMKNSDAKIAGLWTGGKLLKDYENSIPKMVKALGGCCYEPEDITLTKEEIDEAHQLGLKVVVWRWPENSGTEFDPKLIVRLIDWGLDGIITDDPGRLNSMLAARGYPIPQNFSALTRKGSIIFKNIRGCTLL